MAGRCELPEIFLFPQYLEKGAKIVPKMRF